MLFSGDFKPPGGDNVHSFVFAVGACGVQMVGLTSGLTGEAGCGGGGTFSGSLGGSGGASFGR